MAIILYPPDLLNEKLLIKIRDCMINLKSNHPIKKWVLAVSMSDKSKNEIQEEKFIVEIINSKFNLITDQKIKNKVIKILGTLDESSVERIILKSYLYLMIGNITRSDNLLLQITNMTPFKFYQGGESKIDDLDKLVEMNLDKILDKFSRHPADRDVFFLFVEYLRNFTNQKDLLDNLNSISNQDEIEEKINFKYVLQKSPGLCNFLKLKKLGKQSYQKKIQDLKLYPPDFQVDWAWIYLGFPKYYTQSHKEAFLEKDKMNPLWSSYLTSDEKLSEIYRSKTTRKAPSQYRHFFRENLKQKTTFMLALSKLIELGDVDESLVNETSEYLMK